MRSTITVKVKYAIQFLIYVTVIARN